MSKIIDELVYSDSHIWVKIDGNIAYIGITDFAQNQLGSIVYVDMPEVGDSIAKEDEFGAVESVKAASDLIAPLSGTVIETNPALENEPELLNNKPYESWIIKLEISEPSEIKSLMDAEAYKAITE